MSIVEFDGPSGYKMLLGGGGGGNGGRKMNVTSVTQVVNALLRS